MPTAPTCNMRERPFSMVKNLAQVQPSAKVGGVVVSETATKAVAGSLLALVRDAAGADKGIARPRQSATASNRACWHKALALRSKGGQRRAFMVHIPLSVSWLVPSVSGGFERSPR